ncbi:NADP-dependent oxidoreductase, partial [Bacillus pumilus]
GDAIYTRLPLKKSGAFAEYAAIDDAEIATMPKNLYYVEADAVPLAGITAYQGIHEELEEQSGKSVFIPGGSGSFGQMAVPIAKEMGLNVIVSGNAEARE